MKKYLPLLVGLLITFGCNAGPKENIKSDTKRIPEEDIMFEAHLGYYEGMSNRLGPGKVLRNEGEYLGKIIVTKDNIIHCDCLNEELQKVVDTQHVWRNDKLAYIKMDYVSDATIYGSLDCIPEPIGNQKLEIGDYWWTLTGDFYPGDQFYRKAFLSMFRNRWPGPGGWSIREISPCVGDKYLKNKWELPQSKYAVLDAIIVGPGDFGDLDFYTQYKGKGDYTYPLYHHTETDNIKCETYINNKKYDNNAKCISEKTDKTRYDELIKKYKPMLTEEEKNKRLFKSIENLIKSGFLPGVRVSQGDDLNDTTSNSTYPLLCQRGRPLDT